MSGNGIRARAGALLVGFSLALAACGGGGGGASTPPPVITAQPQSSSVADGQSVTLNVSADVPTGASYQWQLNGVPIAGATAASYTTPALSFGTTSYKYSVVVTGAGGSVSSQAANIVVTPVAPTIDVQPATANFADGSAASFGVHANGSQPMSYQWYLNGTAIAGANSSAYTINSAGLGDTGGVYTVQVGNAAGAVTSQAAQLTVTPVPAGITTAPVAQTVLDSSTATFSVAAVGSAALSYQWMVNGQKVPGANSASFSFAAVYANSGEQLSVTVSNAYGSVTSAPVALIVTPQAPTISTAPQYFTATVGGSGTFTESAIGTLPLNYQWQTSLDNGKTWTNIDGATSNSYAIAKVTLANAYAQYRVTVTNVAGTVASAAAVMTVQSNVQILSGTTGGIGYADGTGANARFSYPNSPIVDASGNILVADASNQVVRKITSAGVVTTLLGRAGVAGSSNGPAASVLLNYPDALAEDSAGNLYIGQSNIIQKMTPGGSVTTVAGVANETGSVDGVGGSALFSIIQGLAFDGQGNLIILDGGVNQTVRMMTPSGTVTTLAGTAGQFGSANGQGAAASFRALSGLALDAQGNIYVSDNETVRMITPGGLVSLFAGQPGVCGRADGSLLSAQFCTPGGLAFDASGNLYLAESNDIRMLGTNGQTSTVAGQPTLGPDVDGAGASAVLSNPAGLGLLPNNAGLVFTEFGGAIRTMSFAGVVRTLAGKSGPNFTHDDGPVASATFSEPAAITSDAGGNIYVSDNGTLRYVDTQGNVTRVSMPFQVAGCNAQAMTVDGAGNLYIATCSQVYKRTPGGVVTALAGQNNVTGNLDGPGNQALFGSLRGIAVDAAGNVYVTDMANTSIRKIDTTGNVSTFAGALTTGSATVADGQGTAARFWSPWGIVIDPQGNLYVSDWGADLIRKITPSGAVTTIAGSYLIAGVSSGNATLFNMPTGLALDNAGNLYVLNSGDSMIQRLSPNGLAYPVVGQSGVQALQPGISGAINLNQNSGITVLPGGQIVFTSEQALVAD